MRSARYFEQDRDYQRDGGRDSRRRGRGGPGEFAQRRDGPQVAVDATEGYHDDRMGEGSGRPEVRSLHPCFLVHLDARRGRRGGGRGRGPGRGGRQGPASASSGGDKWEYLDPEGQTRGPFPSDAMLNWRAAGYFHEDLPVRVQGSGDFQRLSVLVEAMKRDCNLPPSPGRRDRKPRGRGANAEPNNDDSHTNAAHPAEALGVEATERRGPREGGRGGRGRRGDFGGDEQGGGRGGGRRGRGRGSEGRGPPPANGNALFPVEVARRLFTAEMQVGADEPVWRYIDLEGNVQGPFPANMMVNWYEKGHLNMTDLRICGTERKVSPPDLPLPSVHYQQFGYLLSLVQNGTRFKPLTPQHIESGTLPTYPASRPTRAEEQQYEDQRPARGERGPRGEGGRGAKPGRGLRSTGDSIAPGPYTDRGDRPPPRRGRGAERRPPPTQAAAASTPVSARLVPRGMFRNRISPRQSPPVGMAWVPVLHTNKPAWPQQSALNTEPIPANSLPQPAVVRRVSVKRVDKGTQTDSSLESQLPIVPPGVKPPFRAKSEAPSDGWEGTPPQDSPNGGGWDSIQLDGEPPKPGGDSGRRKERRSSQRREARPRKEDRPGEGSEAGRRDRGRERRSNRPNRNARTADDRIMVELTTVEDDFVKLTISPAKPPNRPRGGSSRGGPKPTVVKEASPGEVESSAEAAVPKSAVQAQGNDSVPAAPALKDEPHKSAASEDTPPFKPDVQVAMLDRKQSSGPVLAEPAVPEEVKPLLAADTLQEDTSSTSATVPSIALKSAPEPEIKAASTATTEGTVQNAPSEATEIAPAQPGTAGALPEKEVEGISAKAEMASGIEALEPAKPSESAAEPQATDIKSLPTAGAVSEPLKPTEGDTMQSDSLKKETTAPTPAVSEVLQDKTTTEKRSEQAVPALNKPAKPATEELKTADADLPAELQGAPAVQPSMAEQIEPLLAEKTPEVKAKDVLEVSKEKTMEANDKGSASDGSKTDDGASEKPAKKKGGLLSNLIGRFESR